MMYLYAIQAEIGGPIKIGRTENVPARMHDMQCGNPEKLTVLAQVEIGSPADEALAHRLLRGQRYRGEWFNDGERVRSFIARWPNGFCAAVSYLEKFDARLTALNRAIHLGEGIRRTRRYLRTIISEGKPANSAARDFARILTAKRRAFASLPDPVRRDLAELASRKLKDRAQRVAAVARKVAA